MRINKSCSRLKKIKIHSEQVSSIDLFELNVGTRSKRGFPSPNPFGSASHRAGKSPIEEKVGQQQPRRYKSIPLWWRISAISGPLFGGKRRKRGDEQPVPCAKITEEMTTSAGGLLFPRPTFHCA